MKYLKIFTDFKDKMELLGDAERGRLFTAMLEYAESGAEPELRGNERFIWKAVKSDIDRQADNYETICRRNKENATSRYQSQPLATSRSDWYEEKEKEKDKDKDKDKDKEKDKRKKSHSNECDKERAGLFPTPALGDVVSYCRESGSSVNAERFYSYYAARGWKLPNGGDICDWRSLLRSWETKDGKTAASSAPVPGKTTARGNPDDLQRLERILDGIGNTCKEDENG